MLEFDLQDIDVEALSCIEDYLNTIDGTEEKDYLIAVSNISGIVCFARYLSVKIYQNNVIRGLREENES